MTGSADPSRKPIISRLEVRAADIGPAGSAGFANTLVALSIGLLGAKTHTDHERPQPDYATPYVD